MSRFFLFLLLILSFNQTQATHLVGGNLRYEFIGVQANFDHRYKIIMEYFFNCDDNANDIFQDPTLDNFQNNGALNSIDLAIYGHDDPLNVIPSTATSYPKWGYITLDVTAVDPIPNGNPSGCSIGSDICVYSVVYSAIVDLNNNTGIANGGFHVTHERCCRNGTIENIFDPGGAGMTYYAWIPPIFANNTSPEFTNSPLPFICSGDTTTALNTAIDIDGDELIFSYVTPLNGNFTDASGNNINPSGDFYPATYQIPIQEIDYDTGYSYESPFGDGGFYSVVASNGLTTYYCTNQGQFVVGVLIKEYREVNGQVILYGITTREVQIVVQNCPTNESPQINPNAGSTSSSFSVEEGDSLCFDFGYYDPSDPSDEMTLTASGQIFDQSVVNPNATIDSPVSSNSVGQDTVNSRFCWDTDCGQYQNLPYIFSVSVTDQGCPPKTTNNVYEITVTPTNPPANIYGDDIFCQNSTAIYSTDPNSTISYNWSVDSKGTIIQNYGDSVEVLWNTPGTGSISLSAVNTHGCISSSISENATITPSPTVEAGDDITICFGDSVEISGSTSANGFVSLWESTGAISSPNNLQTYVTANETTKFYLSVDIGEACSGIDSVTVNVTSIDLAVSEDPTICLGDSTTIIATSNATDYSWTPNNFINQPNESSTVAFPSSTTQYIVEASTNGGCSEKDTVVVFVSPLPGSSADFVLNGSATNLGNDEYLLTNALNWDTGAVWNNTLVNLNQPFNFDVDLFFGSDNSGADGVAFGLQQISNQVLAVGGGIGYQGITPSLFVEFDTYQNIDLNDIANDHIAVQTNGVLNHNSVNNIAPPISLGNIEDGQWHNCIFDWNPLTLNFKVSVDGLELININYDIINNIFGGTSATYWGFTASTGGLNNEQKIRYNSVTFFNAIIDQEICGLQEISISAPVEGDSYLWEPNYFIDDNTSQSPTFNPDLTTSYVFTATNSFGCFIKDTFEIAVDILPEVIAGNDTSICIGDSTTLVANGNAESYSWDNGIIDGTLFEITTTKAYILTGNSTEGCINKDTITLTALEIPNTFTGEIDGYINLCINDSVQLQGNGADTYFWSPNTYLSDPTDPNSWTTPTTAIEYILTGSLINGCSNTDTLQIDVNPLPNLSTNGNPTICEGDTVKIQAFGGNLYNWLNTESISDPNISDPNVWPEQTTTFRALVSDDNTCEDTIEVIVTVNEKPEVIAGDDQNICLGDSTILNASGNAQNYSWNNGISDGLNFQVNSTEQYILTGTDNNNCVNTDSVNINVLDLPIIEAGENQSICIGDSVQLNATGGDNYLWTPNNSISNNSIVNPFVSPTLDTRYFVTGTDFNGCSNIDSIEITIDALPTINISNDTSICLGDTIEIIASGGVQYQWLNIDSISNTTIPNPNIWPSLTSSYDVKVTAGNNCFDTATIDITINQLPSIFAGNDQDICIGDSTSLNANGTAVSYSWNNGIINGVLFEVAQTQNYILTGTDNNFCSNTDTVTVNSVNLPIIDAGENQSICIGDSIQLNATGGDNYNWTPNQFISNNSIANPFINPNTLTKYFVLGTDANGCTNTDSIEISINSLPTIITSNDTSLCKGDTITVSANGGNDYLWLNTESISDQNVNQPNIWPSSSLLYRVIVTGTNDCFDTADINITVNQLPEIVAGNDTSICLGDSIILNASGNAQNYSWNNGIVDGVIFQVNSTQDYILTGTDNNACSNSDTITINTFDLPFVDAGNDLWVCPGDSIELNVNEAVSYVWSPNSSLDDGFIQNPMANPSSTENYTITITDLNNCSNTDTVILKVEPEVPTNAGGDTLTICEGLSQVLGGNPTSPALTTYQWITSPLSDTSTLSSTSNENPIAQPLNPTMYTVLTSNSICTGIDSIFINFYPSIISSSGENQQICLGDTTSLSTSGGDSYLWSPITNPNGDTIINNATTSNPQIFPIDTTIFYVTITDLNNCTKTDSTIIDVNQLPNFDLGSNASICINDSLPLQASGGEDYIWSPNYNISDNNISNPIVYNTLDTTYFVTVTDSNGCINNDSIFIAVNNLPSINASANDTLICYQQNTLLIGSGGLTYVWSPANSLSNSTSAFPNASPDTSTIYHLTGTDANGCINSDSVLINVLTLPDAFAGDDDTICPGVGIQLNGSGGIDYQWLNPINLTNFLISNPTATPDTVTNYTLQVTDSNGCINTDTLTISLYEPAVANAGFNVSICPNETVLLSASGGELYNWEPANFVNRPDTSIVIASPNDDMEFIVQVTDSNGCVDFDTLQVLVFMASTNADTIICKGDTIQANIFGDPATTFRWSPSSNISDSSVYNPFLFPNTSTSFLVEIENAAGCKITDTLVVQVPDPIASFDTTIYAGCEGVIINYVNTSENNLIIEWEFSDGEISDEIEIEKVFTFNQTFSATLTVRDQYNCINSKTYNGQSLGFDDYFNIKRPNVFTPDGDGLNDIFFIDVPGKIYECTDLVIYNRWGQIQFISTGNNLRWDGRNNVGNIVSNGTYFYTLSVKDKSYNGSVSLYR